VEDDPFAELGLDRSATAEDLRATRRRLARELHPDVGGDVDRMQRINVAFDRALAELGSPPEPARRRPITPRTRRRRAARRTRPHVSAPIVGGWCGESGRRPRS